jgi:CubicO group peptidase (beta-lactamase class C family)
MAARCRTLEHVKRSAAILILTLLGAAHPGLSFEPLPRSEVDSHGISASALEAFVEEVRAAPGARSLVVVHRGHVIAEAFWSGTPETLHHVRSVTKTVSSTLVGIAADRGYLGDLNTRMVDGLPADLVPSDPAKHAILISHLLTHATGLQWDENAEFFPWATSGNPNRYILDKPLVADPGTTFVYNTATTHVLSPVLEELTDRQVEGFAAEFLFAPLGITNWRWEADAQGYAFGGHGLQLRTEDIAKLGLLFIQHGWWQGERVVSTDWVRTATFPHVPGNQPWGAVDSLQYGFLWWLGEGDESPLYFALGWGGQFVVCVPDRDLVVATTANWQVSAEQARAQERAILDTVIEGLLPLVPRREAGAREPDGRSGGAVPGHCRRQPLPWGPSTAFIDPPPRSRTAPARTFR